MPRRLATLAVMSALALALSASPALASSPSDDAGPGAHHPSVVVTRSSSPVAGMVVACGSTIYTVTSGTSELVVRMWPATASGDVHGTETWTLKHVRVVDQYGRHHRVTGFQQFDGTYNRNTGTAADGPFSSYRAVQKLHVVGTRDGSSLTLRLLKDGTWPVKTSGTCAQDPWYLMLW